MFPLAVIAEGDVLAAVADENLNRRSIFSDFDVAMCADHESPLILFVVGRYHSFLHVVRKLFKAELCVRLNHFRIEPQQRIIALAVRIPARVYQHLFPASAFGSRVPSIRQVVFAFLLRHIFISCPWLGLSVIYPETPDTATALHATANVSQWYAALRAPFLPASAITYFPDSGDPFYWRPRFARKPSARLYRSPNRSAA
jgi:hypothetical protein